MAESTADSMAERPGEVLVLPCSGVGKVHGLLSREAAYLAVDELAPDHLDVVCLALLVRGDEETVDRVQTHPCITIDGCGKACAQKNAELAGADVITAVQVARTLSSHRGAKPGTGSELTEEGWAVAREIAEAVAGSAVKSDSSPQTGAADGAEVA
jgi:uncharacterized metal-binding protein